MIFAILFVIIFSIGLVTIPLAWFSKSYDLRAMLVIYIVGCYLCYLFDTEIIQQMFVHLFNICTAAPWSGRV